MDPQQIMQILALIGSSKSRDASSATLDPVLAMLTGNYTEQERMTDDEIAQFYAPTLMPLIGARNRADARVQAAERIAAGDNAFDVASEVQPPKGMDYNDWSAFVQKLNQESIEVQRRRRERDMQQDHFQKQGLPGYGDTYSNEQLLKMFPNQFKDLLSRPRGKSREEMEAEMQQGVEAKEPQGKGWLPAMAAAGAETGFLSASPRAAVGRALNPLGALWDFIRFSKETDKQMAKPEGPPKKPELTPQQKREIERRRFRVGGEGYEALKLQERLRNTRSALESEGRTPLSDTLVLNAMLERLL